MFELPGNPQEPLLTASRARSLIGRPATSDSPTRAESSADAPPPLGDDDVRKIARRLELTGALDAAGARAHAKRLVAEAERALPEDRRAARRLIADGL